MIRNFISELYSLYTPSFFMSGGGSAGGGYVIERSLRFNAASSQYLTRTFGTPTNNTIWTWSKWLKRGSLGSIQCLFSAGSAGVFFNASDQLIFTSNAGATLATSTRVFRDPSAHGHLKVSSDGTTITAHWNNELCLSYTGTITNINSAIAHNIGRNAGGSNQHLDGYDSEDIFVDGQSLSSSSFGETNTATGQWVAKRYTGTYGNNGSYLDFKDGTSTTTLGYDKSGNNNHWTLTNFTRSAGVNDCWMLDVPAGNGSASAVQPSGNYVVLNRLKNYSANLAITNANLTASDSSATSTTAISTISTGTSGKYYFECTMTAVASNSVGSGSNFVGVTNDAYVNGNGTFSATGSYRSGNAIFNLAATTQTAGATYTAGDVIGVAVDVTAGTVQFYKNNVAQGAIPSFTFTAGTELWPFVATDNVAGTKTFNINFGQRSFQYSPPSGFKALCTANLTIPAINKPSDHFNVQLSTGANIKADSEALYANELEWIKDRANANNHQLIDSVRGSSAVLQSNTTAAETTYSAPSGSSVGWVWRASDSAAVTNNNGSISSQVSANPTAGFSIVTYTQTAVAGTIGHGLGQVPKLIIVKNRDVAGSNWPVQHASLGPTQLIILSLTNASSASAVWNNTAPTSSVFSVGTGPGGDVNGTAGRTQVAYCFAEIAGYSKFGSYTGNGSADGPFVYTGFRPKYLLIKASTAVGDGRWFEFDSARDTYNAIGVPLQANDTGAESAYSATSDFLSNGFKLRSSYNGWNASGSTYIYMAFAESPFQYANAR